MTNQAQCLSAEAIALDKVYNFIRILQTIFGIIILILLFRIICFYKTKAMKLHTNLIILVGNVLLLDTIFVISFIGAALMNFIVIFTYKNSCDCLIQVWVVYLIRIPFYLYIAGSPLFHFAIMIERVLATIYVRIYENQGKMLGFISTIIVWSLIALFGLYVYLSSIEDVNTFSYPLPFLTLTSIYNSEILIFIHLFFLFLVVCISVADYFLIHRNLKIKSNFSITTYNLSKSYQAKQNILVMKIIFPLDFSYTFVYVIYNILSTIVRLNKDEYGQLVYIRNYEMINLLLFIHALITLIVYEKFLRKQIELNNNFIKRTKNQSTELYFNRLTSAWK
ncbi:hypothetical protein ACQ4LE_004871 [Meloidogyne hapla]